LPATLGNLGKLKVIEAGNNQLTDLPESIGKLKNLLNLQLHENRLSTLPESINNLSKLELLTLEKNQFEQFDYDLSGLKELEYFELSGSNIPAIPVFLKSCRKLYHLEITNTSIEVIPDWIADIQKLNWLILDENKIKSVPAFLKKLTRLEVLRFSDNLIDTIPGEIFLLPKLKVLDISKNPIRHVPSEILHSNSLEWFNIQDTKIQYAEYKVLRKKINSKTKIGHDSPVYFEDETKPCYTDIPGVGEENVFTKLQTDPYFWGGWKKWQQFVSDNIDTKKVLSFINYDLKSYMDSVVVKFIVRKEGGISNIKSVYFGDEKLKNEVYRLMKLSCVYWVPSNMGGRNINAWFQQLFIFTIENTNGAPVLKVRAENPSPTSLFQFEKEE